MSQSVADGPVAFGTHVSSNMSNDANMASSRAGLGPILRGGSGVRGASDGGYGDRAGGDRLTRVRGAMGAGSSSDFACPWSEEAECDRKQVL